MPPTERTSRFRPIVPAARRVLRGIPPHREPTGRHRAAARLAVGLALLLLIAGVPNTATHALGASAALTPTAAQNTPVGATVPPVVHPLAEGLSLPVAGTRSEAAHGLTAVMADAHRPHPGPIALGARPAFSGHYWTGGLYSGLNGTAKNMSVTIPVPQDNPEAGDFYYVLLSTWDDAGSYDQVGFTNDGGIWGLTYSYTSACAGSYSYNPDAYNLQPGVTYAFAMSIASGDLTFSATPAGSANPVWTSTFTTGGNVLYVNGSYSCSGGTYYGLTDYEEVYQTTAPEPPYEYYFQNTAANGSGLASWTGFMVGGGPTAITIATNSTTVAVLNEPYALGLASPSEVVNVEKGSRPSFANASVVVRTVTTSTDVSVSTDYASGGWVVGYSPLSGMTSLTVVVQAEALTNVSVGADYIGITAGDTSGAYSRVALPVNVLPQLSARLGSSSSAWSADSTQPGTLTLTPVGGVGPFSYQWNSVPDGCATGPTSAVVCAFGTPGAYSVNATVTDANRYAFTITHPFTIFPAPQVSAIRVNPPSRTIDVGQLLTASADITGGSGTANIVWSGVSACGTLAVANYSCYATVAGNFSLSVSATDTDGMTVDSSVTVRVLPDPTLAAPTPSRAGVDVGQEVVVTAAPLGGAGGYTISWSGLPTPCLLSGTTADCSPATAGNYRVTATVTDAANFTVKSGTTLIAVSAPLLVNLTVPSPRVTLGGQLNLIAAAAGGSGHLSYRWAGLPPGCPPANASTISCLPAATGTFPITLEVVDSNGGSQNASVTVAVQPVPASPDAWVSSPLLWLGVIGLVGAAAAAVLIVRRRRGAGPIGPAEDADAAE